MNYYLSKMRSECRNSWISKKKWWINSTEHSFKYLKASWRWLLYIGSSSLLFRKRRQSLNKQNLQKEVRKNFLLWFFILIFCTFSHTIMSFSSSSDREELDSLSKFMKNRRKFVKFFQTKPILSWFIINISSQMNKIWQTDSESLSKSFKFSHSCKNNRMKIL